MRGRERAALVGAALAVGLLWLFVGTKESLHELERGREDWSGDFRSYYLPNAEYASERLRSGALPLWNPQQGAGGPFLATVQVAVLYPPNVLHVVLPEPAAYLALTVLHLALAVVAAGWLAAALGAGWLGAVVAGVAYATSLQVVGGIYAPPVLYAAAWAPALFLGVDRAIAAPSPRRAVGLGIAIAMMLLAGWPYAFAIAGLGAALYGAALLATRGARGHAPVRETLALGLAVLLGFLLAAPQLLPTAELLERSCRALGSLVEGQAVFVRRPHDPAVFASQLRGLGYNDGVPGLAALVFALLALVLSGPGRGRVALLLGVGVFGLLASFPNHLPLYGWLRELPLLGDFRFPYRYRLLPTLALAVAAGVGTTHLQARLQRFRGAPAAAGLLALAACLATVTGPVLSRVVPFARTRPEPASVLADLERAGVPYAAAAGGRVYWAGRSHKLGAVGEPFVVFDNEPLTLARTAQMLTFFETGRPLTLLTLKREPPRPGAPRRPESAAAPFAGYLTLPADGARAAVLDLFSAELVVSDAPYGWMARRFERLTPEGRAPVVYANPHALPRAYRVAAAVPEPGRRADALRRLTADRFDRRALVMLDRPPPELVHRPDRPPPADPGELDIVRYEPERVVLASRGETPGVAVLTDAWFPGWEATVDGEPAPLLRANVGFRGVPVPAGEHVVEMRYRPGSLRRGLWLAGLGGVAALAAVFVWRPGVRQSRGRPSD